MVDSDSDRESTPVRSKPRDFIANYSDEEKSLCHEDEHLNLHQHSVQLYTPEGYLELPGSRAETYEVLSIPNDEEFYKEGNSELVVKSKSTRRPTRTQPVTSETTSSSSDTETETRLRNTGPITDSTDSSNSAPGSSGSGYSGDIDSEFEASRVDHHRKLVDDIDQYSCKTITPIISHRVFCNAITRWQHHRPISLPTIVIPQCGVRIMNCQLHCRGLDHDFYERNATLTAVVKFSQNSIACSSSHTCIVELDVKVYEGRMDSASVHEPSLLGGAKGRRKLSRQERDECVMHIAVHKVVKLDAIVYHETCPNISVITLQITASIQTVRNDDNQELERDSGCIGASKSSGTES